MGFNDFHKGFKSNNQTNIVNKPLRKTSFGPRSVDEIIKSRYSTQREEIKETPVIKPNESVDYQQNMRAQRNVRNLDR